MPKKEWSGPDAQTIVIYGKRTDANDICYPIFANAAGALQVSDQTGMYVPYHDKQVIDESNPTYTTITLSYSSSTVAIKTIAVANSITTITLTLA